MQNKKIFDIIPPKKIETEKEKRSEEIIEVKKKTPIPVLILLITLILLIGGVFHFRWSKVEIKIWPEIKTLNFDTKLTIDTKVNSPDFLAKVIPGKIFEDERTLSQKFTSSGKTTKEEKARGTIRVYNNYHLPQTLIVNTRFQPPLEKVLYFRTTKTIKVPAKSYLDVQVQADRAGEEYNIGPSTFSIPGLVGTPQYYSIYGKSFSSMSGGFKGEAKQVTKEDLEEAKKTLLKKLEEESKNYLKSKISEDFVFFNEGISQEITEATSSIPEEGLGDSFNFTLKTKLKAILFKKSDLENFAKELVNSQLQGKKKIQKELETNYSPELVNLEIGKIILNLKILAKVYSEIDISSFKKELSGKSLREARLTLGEVPEIRKYQIKPFPFWLNKIPKNPQKINIQLRVD